MRKLSMGLLLLALPHCQSPPEIAPDISQHRQLARDHLLANRLDDASDQLELALGLLPDDERSLFLEGALEFARGEVPRARQSWTALTRVATDDHLRSRVETGIGFAALIERDVESAQCHLRIAVDLDPLNQVAREALQASLQEPESGRAAGDAEQTRQAFLRKLLRSS